MFRANRFCRNVFSTSRRDAFLYWFHAWTEATFERCDQNMIHAPAAEDFRIQWEAHPQGLERSTYAEWQAMGFDRESVVADPLFVDPSREDWRLRPGSPATALGFVPIPFERIGIRPPRGEEQIPRRSGAAHAILERNGPHLPGQQRHDHR
jgi:hypothetical protein